MSPECENGTKARFDRALQKGYDLQTRARTPRLTHRKMLLGCLVLLACASFARSTFGAVRAPAPSLFYEAPANLILAMQDITVDVATDGTYWCVLQWDGGYMGLQQGGSGYTKHVHFSVWDPPGTSLSMVTSLNPNTRGGRFGGEGTGVVTYYPFLWETDVTYTLAVTVGAVPGGAEYKGFFYDPARGYWIFLASIFRPGATPQLGSASSFLEDFGATSDIGLSGLYGNAWLELSDGTWFNPTWLYFNVSLGAAGQVIYDGTVVGDAFRLATGGATVNHTAPLTWQNISPGVRRLPPPSNAMPSVSFAATATTSITLSWPLSERNWLVQVSTNPLVPAAA
jgi:hypothetical protein